MRLARLVTAVVSVGLFALPVLGTAGTAQAADTVQTRITGVTISPTLKGYKASTTQFNKEFSLSARIEGLDPNDGQWKTVPFISTATVVLERQLAGSTAWTVIETKTGTSGSYFRYPIKAVSNATYRLRYSGGDYTTSGGTTTFAPATASKALKVMRIFNEKINSRTLVLSGKVGPAFKRKRVVIQRRNCLKKSCKWTVQTRVKTNAKSRFRVKLPARQGTRTYFRAYIPNNKQFVKSYSNVYYTIRF